MFNQSIKITKPDFAIKIVTRGQKILKKEQEVIGKSCLDFYKTYGTIRAKDIATNNNLRNNISSEVIKKIHYITITVKTKEKIS